MNKQLDIIDILSIVSLYLAIKNLEENEQQSEILKNKLDNQDNVYLKKIIQQNEIIIAQNEELLKRR